MSSFAWVAQVGTESMMSNASLSTFAAITRRIALITNVKGVAERRSAWPMTVFNRSWWTLTNCDLCVSLILV